MIGKRLKEFAKNKYGTVSAFAEACSMTQPQMSAYTSDAKSPSIDVLLRFLQAGCDINWLLSGKGEMVYPSSYNHNDASLTEDEILQIRALLKERGSKNVAG